MKGKKHKPKFEFRTLVVIQRFSDRMTLVGIFKSVCNYGRLSQYPMISRIGRSFLGQNNDGVFGNNSNYAILSEFKGMDIQVDLYRMFTYNKCKIQPKHCGPQTGGMFAIRRITL